MPLKRHRGQGCDLDDPATTRLRRRVLSEKPFLRRIYEEWYGWFGRVIPDDSRPALEVGSGAGFMDRAIPDLITSEVVPYEWLRLAADARRLPLAPGSLRAIVAVDVFHHIPEPRRFLAEAVRCLAPGGVLAMIEPWVSSWSRLVYSRLHHEPFDPQAGEWEFPSTGPLSGANGALAWIVFERDRNLFSAEFPELDVEQVAPFMPFTYLLSGGFSMPAVMPAASFSLWRGLESLLAPVDRRLGMFARILVRRRG